MEQLRGVGKARDPGGRGSCSLSSTTSSSRRQCDGGGGSGLFSDSGSFYQLCQLSALSASILRLPEQTKTGATRGRGCQSRRKLMPPRLPTRVLLAGAHLIYSHIRFCIFLTQLWVVCFCTCEDGGLYKRLAISCTGW